MPQPQIQISALNFTNLTHPPDLMLNMSSGQHCCYNKKVHFSRRVLRRGIPFETTTCPFIENRKRLVSR
ncbi:hypothetical protein DPMN_184182 [Dreissena polymorpha]|uniref:Uncharacterized protein n=1 Tax=Dreissena polymorpha TaxID=45954 RepID=A0A9D4DIB8_DREPO|nr:hypothetical protein DPMN_184182 [Dreissena polymorpha]